MAACIAVLKGIYAVPSGMGIGPHSLTAAQFPTIHEGMKYTFDIRAIPFLTVSVIAAKFEF